MSQYVLGDAATDAISAAASDVVVKTASGVFTVVGKAATEMATKGIQDLTKTGSKKPTRKAPTFTPVVSVMAPQPEPTSPLVVVGMVGVAALVGLKIAGVI